MYSSAGIVRTLSSRFTYRILIPYSEEKGYAPDEVDLRVVDLGSYETRLFYFLTKSISAKGENYDPAFLRLNPTGKQRL